MTLRILIVYDTNGGNCHTMAKAIANGVETISGAESVVRCVPKVTLSTEATSPAVPDSGAPYVDHEDLQDIDGLIIGGPTHFGNFSASLKFFLDGTTTDWLSGTLSGKPAGVFTSTGSLHGGQEATLLSAHIPLLHHGMLIVGLPYTSPALMRTVAGGTPYGASHHSGESGDKPLDSVETALCQQLGARVAGVAAALAASPLQKEIDA
jgi:NAD(P)H dehydrogenase (quinone)